MLFRESDHLLPTTTLLKTLDKTKKLKNLKKNKRKADLDLGVLIDDDTDMISGATVCKSKVTISCISQDL